MVELKVNETKGTEIERYTCEHCGATEAQKMLDERIVRRRVPRFVLDGKELGGYYQTATVQRIKCGACNRLYRVETKHKRGAKHVRKDKKPSVRKRSPKGKKPRQRKRRKRDTD